MLEDPSYDQVVRWGNEGDSFVVLEVRTRTQRYGTVVAHISDTQTEREIHEINPAKAFQAQQFRQLCSAAQQIRFPQSEAK